MLSILQGGVPDRSDAKLAPIIWILPEGTANRRQGAGAGSDNGCS